ncbi:MAG: methionyl-tRNA formyltransferase [Clostridia bacterium]|nr:methionyl-tRNA formyltransferase [Clostridia bacterium]
MRIVFLGTPQFSAKILDAIYKSKNEVVCVISQPDRVNGRNNKIEFSPVKKYALENNIPLYQFESISNEGEDIIKALKPDLMITAAYGQLLKQNILDICPIFNVHTSLLPKLRGASPVQTALINGDKETGVTIMKTELKMDAGDIILQEKINIERNINSEELLLELADISSQLILKAIDSYENGTIKYIKQDEKEVTFCKYIEKSMGKIEFTETCDVIYNKTRGMNPNPGTFFFFKGQRIKILKCSIISTNNKNNSAVVVYADKINGFVISCADGLIKLDLIKPEGKNEMSGIQFINGKRIEVGTSIN